MSNIRLEKAKCIFLFMMTTIVSCVSIHSEEVLVVPTAFPKEVISDTLVNGVPSTADSFVELKQYYEDTWAPFFEVSSYGSFNVDTTVTDYVFAQWPLNNSANLGASYWYTQNITGATTGDRLGNESANSIPNPVVDGFWTPGERYIDLDGNGRYTQMEEWWDTVATSDGGSRNSWDAFGEEFADWNNDGEFSGNISFIIVYDEANDQGTGLDAGGVPGDGYYGLPVHSSNLANISMANVSELDLNENGHFNSNGGTYTADLSGDREWRIFHSDSYQLANSGYQGGALLGSGQGNTQGLNGEFDAPLNSNGEIMYGAADGYVTVVGTVSYKRLVVASGNNAEIVTETFNLYRASEKFVDEDPAGNEDPDRVWNDRDPFEDFMVRWEPRYNPNGSLSPPGGWVPVTDAYILANYPTAAGASVNLLLTTGPNANYRTNNRQYDPADPFTNRLDKKIQPRGFRSNGDRVAIGANWDPYGITTGQGFAGGLGDTTIISDWFAFTFDPVSGNSMVDASTLTINSKFMESTSGVLRDWRFEEFDGYGANSLVDVTANNFDTTWVAFSDLENNAGSVADMTSGNYNLYTNISGPSTGEILPNTFFDSYREFRDLPSSLYHTGGDLRFGEQTDPNSTTLYGNDLGGTLSFPNVFPDGFVEIAGPLGHSAFGDKGFDAGSVAALELLTWNVEGAFGGNANSVGNILGIGSQDNGVRQCTDVNLDGLIDQGACPPEGFENYLVTNLSGDRGDGTNTAGYPFNRERLLEDMLEYIDSGIDFDDFSSTSNMIDYLVPAIPTAYDAPFQGLSGLFIVARTRDDPGFYLVRGQPEINPIPGITTAHEFIHDYWGAPDLYDYDTFNGFRTNYPIGNFDVMASGPLTISPVTKNFLGIVQYRSLNTLLIPGQEQTIEIYPHNFIQNDSQYYTYNSLDNDGERYVIYYDSGSTDYSFGTQGLIIIHEDQNTTGEATPIQNRIGDHSQYQIVEADGLLRMVDGTSRGDAGAVFPGTSNKTTFNINSNPKSTWWDGKDSGLEITNIELPVGTGPNDPIRVTFKAKEIMVPTLSFNNPPGGTGSVGGMFSIQANVLDTFGGTGIQVYVDSDGLNYDGTLVGTMNKSSGGEETLSLMHNISGLSDGDYYYYAVLTPGSDIDGNTESGNFIISQLNGGAGSLVVNDQAFGNGLNTSRVESWTFECLSSGGNGQGIFSVTGSLSGQEPSNLVAGSNYMVSSSGANVRIDAASDFFIGDRFVMLSTGRTEYSSSLIVSNGAIVPVNPSIPDLVTTEISDSVREGGTTATFTVRLSSRPTSDVSLNITTSDLGEATVSPSTVFFTPDGSGENAFWRTRTITVQGVDDSIVDGTTNFDVLFSFSSDDSNYDGLVVDPLTGQNIDDETYGLTYEFTDVNTFESDAGTAANAQLFSFKLKSEPLADVTVTISSLDTSEGVMVGSTSFTFSNQNWNSFQQFRVVGVQDNLKDGDTSYQLQFDLQSADANFEGVTTFLDLQNVDDDVANIVISELSNAIQEFGKSAYFTVQLTNNPSDNVILNLSSQNSNIVVPDRETVIFTAENYNTPQKITLHPLEDSDSLDNTTSIDFEPLVSDNTEYNNLQPASLSVAVLDNDDFGVTISDLDQFPSESGTEGRFYIHLDRAPSSTVTVSLSSDDLTEGTVSPSSLTFNSNNWQGRQWVFVQGLDDGVADGRVPFNIELEFSGDASYVALGQLQKTIETIDDELPEVIVEVIDPYTDEYGSQASFAVSLSQVLPTGNTVNLTFNSDDVGEGNLPNGSVSLLFDENNSTLPQVVKVIGVSDNLNDGHVSYSIVPSISGDSDYQALTLEPVSLVNFDKEVSMVIVEENQGLIGESGMTDTFSVRLQSEPTALVTMTLSVSDSSEALLSINGEPSASSIVLEFDNFNYFSPQTITVVGVDDSVADGEVPVFVEFSVSSNDSNYHAMSIPQVRFFNQDNDGDGISLTVNDSITSESGGTAEISIKLNSQPSDVVILDVAVDDVTEGIISGVSSFVFNPSTWATEQLLTVTGVDDAIVDSDVDYALDWTITTNDVSYSNSVVPFVTLTNVDDDNARLLLSDIEELETLVEGGASVNIFAKLQAGIPVGQQVNLDISVVSTDTGIVISSDNTNFSSNVDLQYTDSTDDINQAIYVKVEDNTVVDGDRSARLDFTIDSSNTTSTVHANLLIESHVFSIEDDDKPGISLGLISDDLMENDSSSGNTATFSVQLNSVPSDDVTISFGVSDGSEVEFVGSSFVVLDDLTPGSITVRGVDDDFADGDISASISVLLVSSNDDDYSGMTSTETVSVLTRDEGDFVAINVSADTSVMEGESGVFTFYLDSQPTDTVTISLSAVDGFTFSPSQISFFNNSNFDVAQSITYNTEENGIDEGSIYPKTISITVSSDDTQYNALSLADRVIDITDDDSVSINMSTFSTNIREDGETATALVSLNSEPSGTGNIVLVASSSNTSELSFSPAYLVFDNNNWESSQILEVTGLDDGYEDGNKNVVVTLSTNSTLSDTTDIFYDTDLLSNSQSIDVLDIDSPGINIIQDEVELFENGGTTNFRVQLNNAPDEGEVVTIAFSSTGSLQISPSSVSFTDQNFDSIVSLVVTSTSSVGSNQVETVTASVTSNNYSAPSVSFNFTVVDEDTPQFVITADDTETSEDGDTATIDLSLIKQPTSDVTVTVSSNDNNEVSIFPSTLVFSSANYMVPQTVTLVGLDDNDLDGVTDYTITLRATQSGGEYDGLSSSMSFSNIDNDTPSIQITYDSDLSTTEWGSTETITLTLGSIPSSTVTVSVSLSDDSEARLSSTSLLFSSLNNYQNTVTVTGLDDEIEDGHKFYRVIFDALESSDSNYNGLSVDDVTILNVDDETSGLMVLKNGVESSIVSTELVVQELLNGASTDSFQLKLISEPTGNVVINLSSTDLTEGTISPSQVILDSTNPSEMITLTGMTDEENDGTVSFEIDLEIDSSTTDPNFFDLPILSIPAQNGSFDLQVFTDLILEKLDGENIFDVLSHSGNSVVLTAAYGLPPYSWSMPEDPFNNISVTELTSDNSQILVGMGKLTTSYRFTVTDSRSIEDNFTHFDLFIQGSPMITEFKRPNLNSLQLYFEDISSLTRRYDVYKSLDGVTWEKVNSTPLSSSKVSSSFKPESIDTLMLTISDDGSEESFFQIVTVDNTLNGSIGLLSNDTFEKVTTEGEQVKYEVMFAEDQNIPSSTSLNGGSAGGGCLLK